MDDFVKENRLFTNNVSKSALEVSRLLLLTPNLQESMHIVNVATLAFLAEIVVVTLGTLISDTDNREASTSVAGVSIVHCLLRLCQLDLSIYFLLNC